MTGARARSAESHDRPWDLLVVGGGTAGIVGAKTAARLGARVLLVERERTGGDCLWTGCVPSKALLAAAHVAATARGGERFGVTTEVSVDFARVMDHVRAAIAHIAPVDSVEALEAASVSVRTGTARFTGADSAEVDGRPVRFRQALVATGAAPALPPLPGLSEVDHLTSETVWGLTELPAELAVLGGGSIGCELGQAFARLGSRVSLVEGASRILPREDPRAAAEVSRALVDDGVELHTGSGVARVEPGTGGSGVLHLANGQQVPFRSLLVAVGRAPRTRTSAWSRRRRGGPAWVRRGRRPPPDNQQVASGPPETSPVTRSSPTPRACTRAWPHPTRSWGYAARSARPPSRGSPSPPPRSPRSDSRPIRSRPGCARSTGRTPTSTGPSPRGQLGGFTRLVVDKRGHLLGATVVGPRAGETLGELTIAIRNGLTTRGLAGVTHAYPTYNDGPWNAAISDVQAQLGRPATQRVLGALAQGRSWWLTTGRGSR